ncbi:MAG TPA: hypothetical protein V6C95_20080 [Coleofasciculaceae cyanobacterium]
MVVNAPILCVEPSSLPWIYRLLYHEYIYLGTFISLSLNDIPGMLRSPLLSASASVHLRVTCSTSMP